MSDGGSSDTIGIRLSLAGAQALAQGLTQAGANVEGFGGKVEKTGDKGHKAGISIGQAFSPLQKIFQQTGLAATPLGLSLSALGDSARGIGEQLDQIDKKKPGSHLQKVGTFGAVGGAGIFAAGAALDTLASPMEASKKQLEAAITDTGKNFNDFQPQINAADKHMQNFGIRTQNTNQALSLLTSGLRDPQLALKYLGETADIAATRHESLTAAAETVIQVHAGMNRALRQFGISATSSTKSATDLAAANKNVKTTSEHLQAAQQKLVDLQAIDGTKKKITLSDEIALRNARDNLTRATDAHNAALGKQQTAQDAASSGTGSFAANMDLLSQRTRGQAAASIDTFGGKLDILKAKILDGAAAFGQKYGPAIMGTGAILASVSSVATAAGSVIGHFAKAQDAASTATKAATGQLALFDVAEDTTAAGVWATLTPILLIIAAVLVLAAVGYIIYRNWSTIWGALKGAAMDTWHWIRDHWPLLTEILLGPIGFAVVFVIKHWNTIKHGAQDVWNWIKSNWPYILGFLLGPIAMAAAIIYKHWDDVKRYAGDAEHFIEGVWDGFVRFFTSLPGEIATTAASMFDGVKDAFKSAIDFVLGGWNWLADKTSFTLPHISILGHKIGGEHIGPLLPHLPLLHQGGTVVEGGSAIMKPGEELVVLPPAASVVPLSGGVGQTPGAFGTGPITLQVVLDRKIVAKAVYQDLRDQAARR